MHHVSETCRLVFDNDTVNVVNATLNHRFYSADRHAWIPAAELYIGEHVRSPNGVVQLTRYTYTPQPTKVYNLEVYRTHTYLVGTMEAVVHNPGGGCLVPLGRGTTGRTTAGNLQEQVAMESVLKDPKLGNKIIEGLGDTRWPEPGWAKMEYTVESEKGYKSVIHYLARFENDKIIAVDDFKFKDTRLPASVTSPEPNTSQYSGKKK